MPNANDLRTFAEAAISIFAIVNPIGNIPSLLGMTEGMELQQRRRVFRLAGIVSLGILLVISLAGKFLLEHAFHVSLPAFTLAGGLLLIVVGIRAIVAQRTPQTPEGQKALASDEEYTTMLAVSPIACPLLVGPGTIVTQMLIINRHGILFGLAAGLAAFAAVMLIINYSALLYRLMGRAGALAAGRIMYIFVTAIGVQFIFNALNEAFPSLGK